MSLVLLTLEYFPDPTRGVPVYNGYIYVGEPNTDPEVVGNQKTVTLRQSDGTETPALQPIRTGAGGVALLNGSPVQMLVDGNYSLKVLDKNLAQVYYVESAVESTEDPLVGSGLLLANLRALIPTANGELVITSGRLVYGDGGSGTFYWNVSDLSTEVTVDTLSGVYVAPDSDATGASGAWVRLGDKYDVRHFGALISSSDNFDAFEGASITVNYLGGGEIFVPLGEWAVQNYVLVRSNVFFVGDGYGSHVRNTNDGTVNINEAVTFMIGNYKASGQIGDNFFAVDSYAMDTGSAGDSDATLTTALDSDNFAVGDIVFLFSGESTTWRVYQQMNKVESISAGVLTLKYPVYKDTTGLTMKVGINQTGAPTDFLGRAQQVCANGGLKNMSVSSDNYRWAAAGAMFECTIDDIWVRGSDTLFAMNAVAHSSISRIRGGFRTHGINCAYMSHNSIISGCVGAWSGEKIKAAAYGHLVEENSHDMIFTKNTIDLGLQTGYPLRFAKAAENNLIADSKYTQHNQGAYSSIFASFTAAAGGASNAPRGGNIVDNVRFDRAGADTSFYSSVDDWATGRHEPNIVRNCVNYMPDWVSPRKALSFGSSDWHFLNNKSTHAGVTVINGANGIVIDGYDFDAEENTVLDPEGILLFSNLKSPSSHALKASELYDFSHNSTSSTDTANVIATTTIPQGTLRVGDRLDFIFTGRFIGTTAPMHMEIFAGGVKVVESVSSPTLQGASSITGGLTVKATNDIRYIFTVVNPDGTTAEFYRTFVDLDGADLVIEFRAYVDNAADSILPFDTRVTVERLYL